MHLNVSSAYQVILMHVLVKMLSESHHSFPNLLVSVNQKYKFVSPYRNKCKLARETIIEHWLLGQQNLPLVLLGNLLNLWQPRLHCLAECGVHNSREVLISPHSPECPSGCSYQISVSRNVEGLPFFFISQHDSLHKPMQHQGTSQQQECFGHGGRKLNFAVFFFSTFIC